ncbi:YicC/YloC family endoribonuclease [Endozoicomonadaceae bacterium StTr2]
MTSSMTAFARVESQQDWGSLVWEIRSVNHRYLEPHFRLPESLREIEPALREQLRKNLYRGKVECSLKLQLNETSQTININSSLLKQLHQACDKVKAEFSDTGKVNPLAVLNWPGVLEADEADFSVIREKALQSFREAMIQLTDTRKREGAELQQFIFQRLDSVGENVREVQKRMPDVLAWQRQRINQRLEDAKVELEANRLEQEMVMVAQKCDVEEELDRLNAHSTEVRRVLEQSKGAIGRRLDFLMQELNREANTLASKSIDADVTRHSVNLKVLIEQMREQIQNIE